MRTIAVRLLLSCLLLASGATSWAAENSAYQFREGDIVLSGSEAGQGAAIMAATASPYTHCGIVVDVNGRLMVLEAVQPVGLTTLETFMARSRPEVFTARRLKTPMSADQIRKARAWAKAQIGRNYDHRFRWDDQTLYCSELVWKIYQNAGIELCAPRRFRDYRLDAPAVRRIIEERYGSLERLPLEEKVVAPSDLAGSPLLVEVPRREAGR